MVVCFRLINVYLKIYLFLNKILIEIYKLFNVEIYLFDFFLLDFCEFILFMKFVNMI